MLLSPLLRARPRVLPGFDLALGMSLFQLCLIVLIPLSAVFLRVRGMGWHDWWTTVSDPRVVASYRLTFAAALLAALVNAVMGLLVAWVLVRERFWGRRLIDALVDLPFALPTAVAGITLSGLYADDGWLGQALLPWLGKIAYTPKGVWVAMTFIGLPFVVRTVQPVLEDLGHDLEEAAHTLGAGAWQSFRRVVFPALMPALLTGVALAFARALGEYGSIIFIAGNLPMVSEITPLLIVAKLEAFDYSGASAIAVMMLLTSFVLLLLINALQVWMRRVQGR